jgi:hypothetical protein
MKNARQKGKNQGMNILFAQYMVEDCGPIPHYVLLSTFNHIFCCCDNYICQILIRYPFASLGVAL